MVGGTVVVDPGAVVVGSAEVVSTPVVAVVSPVVVGGPESRLKTATMATTAMTRTIKVTSRPRDMASGYDEGSPLERTAVESGPMRSAR